MSKIKAADDRCPEVVIGRVHRREVEMRVSMAMIWLPLVARYLTVVLVLFSRDDFVRGPRTAYLPA